MLGTLFASLYRFFAPRRIPLFALTLLLIGGGLAGLAGLEVREDIEAMLPDDHSQAAEDFRRLRQAPFSRKVLIGLSAAEGQEPEALLAATDRLAQALSPDYFSRVVTGPAALENYRLPGWLTDNLPNLLTPEDLPRLGERLAPEAIERRLTAAYDRLLSPEGWLVKGQLRRDPLSLGELGLEKLRFVNPVAKTRLRDGHFLSADGRHALIIADSPVAMTDSREGARLLTHFAETAASSLPEGVSARLVSGHAYTVANAETIQRDLFVVLSASTLALAGLFLVFLRCRRSLFVFLIPVAVVGLAAVVVSWTTPVVSGVTLGFGAVLLGIAVDYGLHVYFALRTGSLPPDQALGRLSRPVLFGALTSLAGFAVLLTSSLPGQRQLAVFAMTGIALAVLLALIVLPHLLKAAAKTPRLAVLPRLGTVRRRPLVLGLWLAGMLLCGSRITDVPIDGNLRSLGLMPKDLVAAEEELRATWGELRSQALFFAEGSTLEEALVHNDRLFEELRRNFPETPLVSLAPLLPAAARQEENRAAWQTFWREWAAPTRQQLLVAGAPLGFAETAFAPFFAALEDPPPAITPAALREQGLGELLDALLLEEKGRVRVLTLAPDTPALSAWFEGAKSLPAGVHLVSPSRFGDELGEAIRADFTRFILLAGGAVLLMVTLLLRRPGSVLLALLPVATGLTAMFGIMGWLGMSFNLFNIVATILVIGLSVDYGIFMVCRSSAEMEPETARAVLLAGLTTLAGFGALVLARHPALHSIGLTVLLGIGAAMPTALLVIPALRREGKRTCTDG